MLVGCKAAESIPPIEGYVFQSCSHFQPRVLREHSGWEILQHELICTSRGTSKIQTKISCGSGTSCHQSHATTTALEQPGLECFEHQTLYVALYLCPSWTLSLNTTSGYWRLLTCQHAQAQIYHRQSLIRHAATWKSITLTSRSLMETTPSFFPHVPALDENEIQFNILYESIRGYLRRMKGGRGGNSPNVQVLLGHHDLNAPPVWLVRKSIKITRHTWISTWIEVVWAAWE